MLHNLQIFEKEHTLINQRTKAVNNLNKISEPWSLTILVDLKILKFSYFAEIIMLRMSVHNIIFMTLWGNSNGNPLHNISTIKPGENMQILAWKIFDFCSSWNLMKISEF